MNIQSNTIFIPTDRIGWWGGIDERPRCKFDGKVALSREDAEYKAKTIKERESSVIGVMTAYKCKKSDIWHVGHKKVKDN